MLGHLLHDDGVAQIRLVGAIFAHGLGIGNARPVFRHRLALAEFFKDAGDDGLHRGKHVVLGDETHFDVELVEFAGQAVGARVLVAEAGGDLEIAVETRHHQQLLVLLRRLRQGVKLAGVDARGHQEVAGAFRRGGREDRRLELVETGRLHARAHRIDNAPAQNHVVVDAFAAQVEEAIFQAGFLGIVLVAEHRQRQFGGGSQNLDVADVDLDLAGGEFVIVGALAVHGRASPHVAVEPHHPFGAKDSASLKPGKSGSTTHWVIP